MFFIRVSFPLKNNPHKQRRKWSVLKPEKINVGKYLVKKSH